MSKEPSEFNVVSDGLADYRNDSHSSSLLIYHSDGRFVCDYTRNSAGWSVSWNRYHIQTYGTYAGHSFKFFDSKGTTFGCFYHSLILTYRNECSTETSDI